MPLERSQPTDPFLFLCALNLVCVAQPGRHNVSDQRDLGVPQGTAPPSVYPPDAPLSALPLCDCSTISGTGSFCAAVSGITERGWVDVLKQPAIGEYQGGFVLQRRQYARQCNIRRYDVHSKHGCSQTFAARYGLAAERLREALRCQRNAAAGHSAVDAGTRRSRCLDSCYQSTDSHEQRSAHK